MTPPFAPLEVRFWRHVEIGEPRDCWRWTGFRNTPGYGMVLGDNERQSHPAHRVAYELTVGPIPDGLVIDHLCRNRECVNPFHLEPVTDRINILRGEGRGARSFRRDACLYGHPYDDENTVRTTSRARVCRVCKNATARRLRLRKKEASVV